MADDDRYERGRARFLEVHDEKALRAVEGLGDIGRTIVEFVYGDVYSRPGLSTRDREIAAVATLVALGRSSQLPQHLRASLKAGVTPDELREVILQTATIAGRRFDFAAGERIHTENSYKYAIDEFGSLAARAGFAVVHSWTDSEELFSVHYLRQQ